MDPFIPIVREEAKQLATNIGRAAMHSSFPNDFEYYAIAFEMVDHNDDIVDLLTLPVLPSSISQNYQHNTNIKRSHAGVNVLFSDTFQPFSISLNGTFGRRFRFLFGQDTVNGTAFQLKLKGESEFDIQIKNGYGVTKVLERILNNSVRTDPEQRPFSLYFHNLAFNTSVLVEVVNYSFTQDDRSNNMLWNYSINLRAIAPSNSIRLDNKKHITYLIKASVLQKSVNQLYTTTLEAYKLAKTKLLVT